MSFLVTVCFIDFKWVVLSSVALISSGIGNRNGMKGQHVSGIKPSVR